MSALINIIGWYGTAAIIGAYALVSFSILSPESVLYQALNGTGAIGIVVVSLQKKAYQPAVLNIIWTAIAAVAVARMLL
ncbi:MAG: Uncharacterized protein Greene041619_414 [Candidatus Peregrinibacteria bacterium Greene0416_19]|nr:MAG: Uncharacterized protein Greene041619_414 [Candidatus Peregrinibacteria bacterium Greene0416_19]